MKRGGPLKRRTPLKASPPKPQDGPARAPLRRKTEMKRGTGLRSKPTAERWSPQWQREFEKRNPDFVARGRGDKAPQKPADPWRVQFKARRPARGFRCFRHRSCKRQASSWHHVLAQEHIRTHVRGLCRPRTEDRDEKMRRYCRQLLRDERNLIPVCAGCHEAIERGATTVSVTEAGPDVLVFARELGEWAVLRVETALNIIPAAGRSGTNKEDNDG